MFLSRFHCIKWQGRLSLTAGYRWQSSSQKLQEADQSDHPKAVKPFSAVPSPSGALPIIGHVRLLKDVKSFSKFITEKFRELGPIFRLNFIGQSQVFIADPSAVEKVYRHEGKYPFRSMTDVNADWILKRRKNPEARTFVFRSGEDWRTTRSKMGQQVVMPANVYGYCPGFTKASKRFIRNVKDLQNDDGTVNDVRDLIRNWSLEVSAHFVFGADLDCKHDEHGHAKELQDSFNIFAEAFFDLQTALPLYKVFPTPSYKRFNKGLDRINEIGDMYASKCLSDIKASAAVSEKAHGMSLLEQWLIEGKMNQSEAVAHAVGIFGVGLDTTVNSTAFLLFELAKHPKIQEKACKQLTSVMGNKEADGNSLQEVPYLGHLLKETQRLYSVTNVTSRILDTDIELLGYHIPAKTQIMGGLEAMGEDPKLFKDSQQFNPDRWATDDIHPFIVLPFGFGPRGCWGRRFSEIEMKVLLSEVIRHFKMECDYPDDRLPYEGIILSKPNVPIKIKFTPREHV